MHFEARITYLESEILGSSPARLVTLLYRSAQDAIGEALKNLAAGDILSRGRAIAKAQNIVGELAASLDRKHGGELAHNLSRLYVYIIERLAFAHISQRREPLIEVSHLLANLSEGWEFVDENEPQPEKQQEQQDSFLSYDPEPLVEYQGLTCVG